MKDGPTLEMLQNSKTNKRENWFQNCKVKKTGAESWKSAAKMAPRAKNHYVTITTTTGSVGLEFGPSLNTAQVFRHT